MELVFTGEPRKADSNLRKHKAYNERHSVRMLVEDDASSSSDHSRERFQELNLVSPDPDVKAAFPDSAADEGSTGCGGFVHAARPVA